MKNILLKLFICLMMPLWMLSCRETVNQEEELPSRTFRPIKFTREIIDNTVKFTWVPLKDVTYVLEISRDSMEFKRDLMAFSFENANQVTMDDLWSGERYSARIKAINNNTAIPESEYAYTSNTNPTFVMPSTGIFLPVTSSDIGIDQVVVKWNTDKPVDRISVMTGGVEVKSVSLSEEDKAAEQKTITGLASETAYIFQIYSGVIRRGQISASTLMRAKSVEITDKDVILVVGRSKVMNATVLPADAFNKAVVWSSDNVSVVDIDSLTGKVTAISEGLATITVTTVDGGHKASCIVKAINGVNLLINGGFETTFTAPVENWIYVPWDWFVGYYSSPGDQSRYNNAEIARNTGDILDPTRITFFKDVAQGTNVLRFNNNRLGGVYQLVSVIPGHEYMLRADIAFCKNSANEISQMESVKILYPDGSKFYEAKVPTFVYTIFNIGLPAGQTFQPQGGIVEVTGRFTVPEGVSQIRFQLDQRTAVGGANNQTPRTYIDNCELFEIPNF